MKHRSGFSLVEVALAMSLVTFCLISLIALLPMGLKTANSVWEEAAATSLLQQISQGIRDAATNSSGSYVGAGPCTNLSWTIGGDGVTTNYFFTLGGVPTNAANSRLTVQVALTPPVSALSSGSAWVSVAWPQQAQWNTNSTSWSNALGYVNTRVIFVPRQ